MMKCEVRSPEQALAYLTDCTLATVQSMAMRKNRPNGEFKRQISIAQHAIDWMIGMNVDFSSTRAADVMKECHGNVSQWAGLYTITDGKP